MKFRQKTKWNKVQSSPTTLRLSAIFCFLPSYVFLSWRLVSICFTYWYTLPPPTTIIASMSSSPPSSPSPRSLRDGEWTVVGSPKRNKSRLHDNGLYELHRDDDGARKPSSNLNNVALSDSSSSRPLDDPRRISASPETINHHATTNKASFFAIL